MLLWEIVSQYCINQPIKMKSILNLDKDFQPYGAGIAFKSFNFPSGCEVHIKLFEIGSSVIITTRLKSSDDVMMLLMATDALKRSGVADISLRIPFLPYARQDRVMVKGEPLSIKVMADLLNSQGYSQVVIFDPHSEVCLALITNSQSISNHRFVANVLKDKSNYFVVSPDAGAYKKIFSLCQEINYKDDIILCNKIRDVSNGNIKSITVDRDDLQGKDCFIVDDICDGGGTFNLLSQELRKRNAGKINLIVSHGIFSQGLKTLCDNLDHIYTTNSFMDINSINEFGMRNEKYLNKVTQLNVF